MKSKPFVLRLHPDLRARLEQHAQEKGLPLADYIRMILTEKMRLKK